MGLGDYNSGARISTSAMLLSNKSEVIILLQRAITNLDMYKHFSEKAFLKAMDLSLHGEKRRERDFMSEKEYCLIKDLQCQAKDLPMIAATIEPEEKQMSFDNANDFGSYFKIISDKVWTEYFDIHDIANKLVVLNFKPLACNLYKWTECLYDIGIELNRIIQRGIITGWQLHDVLIYQNSFHNIHDYYEKHYNIL